MENFHRFLCFSFYHFRMNGAHVANGCKSDDNEIVTFELYDARTELKLLQSQLTSDKDKEHAKDLQKFLLQKEQDYSWLLDDQLHSLIASTLSSGSEDGKTRLLRILSLCSLKSSFINFINLDRKTRSIMNYATQFQTLSLNEQKALAVLICNLFSHPQTSNYAIYFSQWTSNQGKLLSNAQIVVDLASHCLSSLNPSLIQYGSGIMFNISLKHVKVLEKPINEDPETTFDEANLDCEDISHSTLSEKKGSFVALKAYDEMVVEICSSLWEVITTAKDIDHLVMHRILKTMSNFVHMLDFADSEMAQELKNLSENVSESNQLMIAELLDKLSVK